MSPPNTLASLVQREVAHPSVAIESEGLSVHTLDLKILQNHSITIPQSLSLRLATAPFAQGGLFMFVLRNMPPLHKGAFYIRLYYAGCHRGSFHEFHAQGSLYVLYSATAPFAGRGILNVLHNSTKKSPHGFPHKQIKSPLAGETFCTPFYFNPLIFSRFRSRRTYTEINEVSATS